MAEGEQYTIVAKRFLERASAGRRELERDDDRIKEAVSAYLSASDPVARIGAINAIAASHGEFAAPRFVNLLADDDDPERVRTAVGGLMGLGDKAVLPLVAALASGSETQRRNAAMTLGFIADPRAGAHLLATAESDASDSVRGAAAEAAARCGASGSAATALLTQGNAYHAGSSSVLFDSALSDVVWSMDGNRLAATDVPAAIYNNELAKDCFYKALALDANSLDAAAGIARESVDISAKLDTLAAAGQDVADLQAAAAEGMLAVESAGLGALDRALQMSVASGDAATGARLAAVIGAIAGQPTAGLNAAMSGGGLSMQGEAAVALAHIAVRSQTSAGGNVVEMLGRAAGRRVVKVAVIIDGDAQRAAGLVEALAAQNVLGQHAGSGTQGIVMLSQLAGVDAILVGDDMPDLTADAVVQQVRMNPAFEATRPTCSPPTKSSATPSVTVSTAPSPAPTASTPSATSSRPSWTTAAPAPTPWPVAPRRHWAPWPAAHARTSPARWPVSRRPSSAAVIMSRSRPSAPLRGRRRRPGGQDARGPRERRRQRRRPHRRRRRHRCDREPQHARRGRRGLLSDVIGGDASIEVRSAAARAMGRMNLGGPARAGVLEAVRVRVGSAE